MEEQKNVDAATKDKQSAQKAQVICIMQVA